MASSIFLLSSWCVLGAAGNAGGCMDSAAACHSMPLGRHDCGSRVRKVYGIIKV